MLFEDVETFIKVIESGSIAQAAEKMYIGQGTASSRIKRLEEELNITLLFRQPGIRKISLTAEGTAFYNIAKQWVSLQQQALSIQDMEIFKELKIASNISSNSTIFKDIYPYFTNNHPNIKLYLQTEHSTEIHQLIEQQSIDIGFVNSLHQFPNVNAKALWKEDLVLLYHKDSPFQTSHHFSDLNEAKEIYSTYSGEFIGWHDRIFGKYQPMVTIGDLSLLASYILYPDTWAIVPHSIADALCIQHQSLEIFCFSNDCPPERITYLLTYKYSKPWIEELTALFLEETYKTIANSPFLTIL